MKSQMAGRGVKEVIQEGIAQSSEGNSQGKLAISEAVEVKVIWLILQETWRI